MSEIDMNQLRQHERVGQQVAELQAEVAKWKRIRTPGHGPCCTCQACGLPHDECRCDLDDVADDAAQAEEKAVSLQVIVDRLRNALLNIRAVYHLDNAVRIDAVLRIVDIATLPDKSKSTEEES